MTTICMAELLEEKGERKIKFTSHTDGTNGLEQLIHCLGEFRSQVQPQVRTQDPQVGEMLVTISDPRWYIGGNLEGHKLLSIRHPGLGWLTFSLPPESTAGLIQQLMTNPTVGQTGQVH